MRERESESIIHVHPRSWIIDIHGTDAMFTTDKRGSKTQSPIAFKRLISKEERANHTFSPGGCYPLGYVISIRYQYTFVPSQGVQFLRRFALTLTILVFKSDVVMNFTDQVLKWVRNFRGGGCKITHFGLIDVTN